MSDYIKLYRTMLEWQWYRNINTKVLFLHMLLKANWKAGKFEGKVIPRGSFVSSIRKLAEETELTQDEVRTALNNLLKTNAVTKQSTNKFTVFTVVNYELYQSSSQTEPKQNPSNSHAIPKRFPTIEEKKEGKKERNNNIVEPVGQDSPDDIGQAKEKGYKPSEFELKCVDFLIQSILNELPSQKVPKTDAEISKWAVHINRMQRIDGLDIGEIWDTLVWTMQNPFWRTNIRSTSKFRKKFQTLYLQSKQSYQNSKKNPFIDYKQNDYDFSELENDLLSN